MELTQLRRREIKSPAGFAKVAPKSTWGHSKRVSMFDQIIKSKKFIPGPAKYKIEHKPATIKKIRH